jgi:ribonuclease J
MLSFLLSNRHKGFYMVILENTLYMIEMCTVGGYSEVGRNMTAVKVDDEVVIFDMGLCLPKLINFEEEGGQRESLTTQGLIKLGAIPNDNKIKHWRDKVKAIAITHCHLDHLGAIPYLASHYKKVPVIGSPYTIEVLKRVVRDERKDVKNPFKVLNPNAKMKISDNLEIEFINMTHSTPQAVMIALHTKYGTIIYANDFKFDNNPIVGKKPNFDRLKELGKENVIALVVDSLYASKEQKTPSEKVAREMLKDVMLGTESADNLIIATTFASQIARLKSIIDFGKVLNRKILFFGRSLAKYVGAAEAVKLVNFTKDVELVPYKQGIMKKLREIEKNGRTKYLIVCTGNQGEPEAVLSKMADDRIKFDFLPYDHVIFSCRTIPDPANIKNRDKLEKNLKKKKVRIFKDIHVSGHASREDLRDFIQMVNPQKIFPAHIPTEKQKYLVELAEELGYEKGKTVIQSEDGDFKKI